MGPVITFSEAETSSGSLDGHPSTPRVISLMGVLLALIIRRVSLRVVPWMPEELSR